MIESLTQKLFRIASRHLYLKRSSILSSLNKLVRDSLYLSKKKSFYKTRSRYMKCESGNCCIVAVVIGVIMIIAIFLEMRFGINSLLVIGIFIALFIIFCLIGSIYYDPEEEERERKRQERKRLAEYNKAQKEQELKDKRAFEILSVKNKDLFDRFLEVCSRKVTIDEYGDEDLSFFPKEVKTCLKKLEEREKRLDKHEFWWHEKLEQEFRDYYAGKKKTPRREVDLNELTGFEFETLVADQLKEYGFDVSGTPRTGDQGADLIARKDDRMIIVQVKRAKRKIGNKAVQEVISALKYYQGTEAWVITNASFTKSAIELAQRANVKLFDSDMIDDEENFV